MPRTPTLAGLVALLVLALLGTAAPGYADSFVHRDSTKDVVRVPRNGSTCSDCQRTDRPDADVVQFRAAYGAKVRLSATLRAVPRRGTIVWSLRYAPKTWLTLGLHRKHGDWSCAMLLSADPQTSVPCPDDLTWRVNRHRAAFRATVPSRLVNDAPSIRVGAGAFSFTGRDVFVDDAMRTTFNAVNVGLAFKAGPRIRRG